MRRFVMIAAIGLVAAGCTSTADDDPTGSPSTPSVSTPSTTTGLTTAPPTTSTPTSTAPSTPTVPTDVPTTGPNAKPSERPPVMPVAATRHTAAGARAFARFFLQTIDWGYATTNSSYMRRYFVSSCQFCVIVRRSLNNAQTKGSHYVGGRITVVSAGRPFRVSTGMAQLAIPVKIDITSIELISKTGKASLPDVAYRGLDERVRLLWRSGWRVSYVGEASK